VALVEHAVRGERRRGAASFRGVVYEQFEQRVAHCPHHAGAALHRLHRHHQRRRRVPHLQPLQRHSRVREGREKGCGFQRRGQTGFDCWWGYPRRTLVSIGVTRWNLGERDDDAGSDEATTDARRRRCAVYTVAVTLEMVVESGRKRAASTHTTHPSAASRTHLTNTGSQVYC
jgi:hypothetical protein